MTFWQTSATCESCAACRPSGLNAGEAAAHAYMPSTAIAAEAAASTGMRVMMFRVFIEGLHSQIRRSDGKILVAPQRVTQ